MQQPEVSGELTEAERALLAAVARGELADMRRAIVRGSVLREILLERRPGIVIPPAGLRISRVIVDGGLDLEGVTLTKPLLLWHSRIQGASDAGTLVIRDARLKRLGLHSCTVEGLIMADRVEIESGLYLGGGVVRGHLQIRGAQVGGALGIDGTEIGDGKTALLAAGLTLSGPLIVRRGRLLGEVSFPRSRLGGGLYAEDAVFSHSGLAVDGESARLEGDLLLDRAKIAGGLRLAHAAVAGRIAADGLEVSGIPDSLVAPGLSVSQGISMAGARFSGTVRLDGADIGKAFRAEGLEIDGGEAAIVADVIAIGGNWELARARLTGCFNLPGARIDGQLRMTEASVACGDGAIRGDGAIIRGGVFLSRSALTGLVRFPAAELGNQFRLRGATLKVDHGAALLLSGSTFARDVELNGGLQSSGALVLDQVVIRGVCDFRGSMLKSAALARGGGPPARGDLHDHTRRTDELVVSLVDAEIDRLQMPDRAAERPRGIVDLSRARVGSYDDALDAWPPPPGQRGRSSDGRDIDHLVIDGFVYEHLTAPSGSRPASGRAHQRDERVAAQRLHWLEGQDADSVGARFKPQAWVALAERLTAQGYHEDARMLTIARLRRERRSASARLGQRLQGAILDLVALYGYNPWRTIAWMVGFIVIFAGIWGWAASHCTPRGCVEGEEVFVVTSRDGYAQDGFADRYPAFSALAYSFDLFVPFVSIGYENHWRPNLNFKPLVTVPVPDVAGFIGLAGGQGLTAVTVTAGGLLYLLGVIEMLIGLVLTSLAVTGFTGLLRGGQ